MAVDNKLWSLGTGRRKSSVARVRIRPGSGQLKINNRSLDEYFSRDQDRYAVRAPLGLLSEADSLDIFIRVHGGGTTGQSGAIKLGIARAIREYNDEYDRPLRDAGYLTRDDRKVERKKPGLRGARRATQFSKR
jgi:small subunit ribosomal protein S9